MNKNQFDQLSREEKSRFFNVRLKEGLTTHGNTMFLKEKNTVKILYIQDTGYTSESVYNLDGMFIKHEYGGQPRALEA